MARRPRVQPSSAEPDELARLVELESRLAARLETARSEAHGRVELAEAAARTAESSLDRELEPLLAARREQAGQELAARLSLLRERTAERIAALDALEGSRFDALVQRALSRVAEPAP